MTTFKINAVECVSLFCNTYFTAHILSRESHRELLVLSIHFVRMSWE